MSLFDDGVEFDLADESDEDCEPPASSEAASQPQVYSAVMLTPKVCRFSLNELEKTCPHFGHQSQVW